MFMDCVEAIAMNDGRELWVINFDMSITGYVDDFCMSAKDGKILDNSYMAKYSCGDPRAGKWIVDRNHASQNFAFVI
jgi:hypothetical protein